MNENDKKLLGEVVKILQSDTPLRAHKDIDYLIQKYPADSEVRSAAANYRRIAEIYAAGIRARTAERSVSESKAVPPNYAVITLAIFVVCVAVYLITQFIK